MNHLTRFLILSLALLLMFSLAACGGGTGSTSPSGSQSGVESSDGNIDADTSDNSLSADASQISKTPPEPDISTAESYLGSFGLTLDDVRPENTVEINGSEYLYNNAVKNAVFLQFAVDDKDDTEKFGSWLKQIHDKLKQVSDDGRVLEITDKEVDIDNVSTNAVGHLWYFIYNGFKVEFSTSNPASTGTYSIKLQYD